MSEGEVTVVVPVWNQVRQAEECLGCLARVERPRITVIAVDNGSKPDEAEMLADCCRRLGQGFELLKFPGNRGFAAAANAGLRRAFSREAEAVLLLNSDAVVSGNTVRLLLAAARARGDIGIVGPRVIDPGRQGREVSCGERISPWFLPLPRKMLRRRKSEALLLEVGGVLGCAMLITRPCYLTVGPLNESFFAYYEEVEYCLRARAQGFSVVVAPGALVWHEPGRGFGGGFSPLAGYLKSRNLVLLMRSRARWYHWPLFIPEYAAMMVASGLYYAGRREGRVLAAMARGVLHGLLGRGGPPPAELLLRAGEAGPGDEVVLWGDSR